MTQKTSPFERNREPILEKLAPFIPEESRILEIGSGSGEHARYFTNTLSNCQWQCSERSDNLSNLKAKIDQHYNLALLPPLQIDLYDKDWAKVLDTQTYDLVLAINVIHIAAWEATPNLMEGAAPSLKPQGHLFLYGPYRFRDKELEPSNQSFEEFIKATYPGAGLRYVEDVVEQAAHHQLMLIAQHDMPANNQVLCFQKQ